MWFLIFLCFCLFSFAFPITADPPVASGTLVCSVPLFNVSFTSFSGVNFSFVPPSCFRSGKSRLVLSLSCSVTAGRQFDRTVVVFVEDVLLMMGTTSEPRKDASPAWNVSADVTDYVSVIYRDGGKRNGQVKLGTVVDSTYNGVPSCSAKMQVFAADLATAPPDFVIPLHSSTSGALSSIVALPLAASRVSLVVVAQV
jgi:hypothetical protein